MPPLDIHFIAIGGTGMAPLACLLQARGHRVRGSDGPLYPPMSTLLEKAGIIPFEGFDPAHLQPPPDLVIVGNAVPRSNPEAEAVEHRGLPRISMPEALARFFLAERSPLVIAGTHGKTTTTTMAAWVYHACDAAPGYLIGGAPQNLASGFAIGAGPRFIIEGDEYNAAYFDRGPKFLHYCPQTLILTSVEHDHADLYPDPATLTAAYQELIALLPADGLLVACGDTPPMHDMVASAACRVLTYGLGAENDVHPDGGVESGPWGSRFRLPDGAGGTVEITLPQGGDHNVTNALGVWAAARADGLGAAAVASALGGFQGVKRRLETLGTNGGITVVDDFAHHPTAVAASLDALRQRYPGRRLLALFEPRSLTAGRAFLQADYLRAFSAADAVFLAPIYHRDRLRPEERIDRAALCTALAAAGVAARAFSDVETLFTAACSTAQEGDVLVTMSSGDFRGIPHRLHAALKDKT